MATFGWVSLCPSEGGEQCGPEESTARRVTPARPVAPTHTHTPSSSTRLVFSEQNLERQVLQTQCRRLEAQHYSLSLTAEQLSHSMAVSATGEEGPGRYLRHSQLR